VPLAFSSLSHGTIAFGYFNIESDMLLLEQLFFFTDLFCDAVISLDADAISQGSVEIILPGWRIDDRSEVGNLHGAIAGMDHSGFIGATYRRYPFPTSPSGFKQNPEGSVTQREIEAMIHPFGRAEALPLRWNRPDSIVSVAEIDFDLPGFAALLAYVDRGGYPRWRDDVRPEPVKRMIETLRQRGSRLIGESVPLKAEG
jgi:hypothetical protein